MPLPSPKKSQTKSTFISQCIGNDTMNKEFPDQKQRIATCYSLWERKKSKANLVISLGNDDEVCYFDDDCDDKDDFDHDSD